MKKNMGVIDRVVRVLIAIAFVLLYALGIIPGILGTALIFLSLIFVLTSSIGVCPLYSFFGTSTRHTKKAI